MTVRYFAKNVYGINRFYVLHPSHEKAIKMITGHKTLTFDAIQGFQRLGIKFEQVLDPALDVFEFNLCPDSAEAFATAVSQQRV